MKTKYVFRALISLYVNFHNNRTMWSTNFYVKICRWGEKEKEPKCGLEVAASVERMKNNCINYHRKLESDETTPQKKHVKIKNTEKKFR